METPLHGRPRRSPTGPGAARGWAALTALAVLGWSAYCPLVAATPLRAHADPPPVSFAAPITSAAGHPSSLAAADLTGDGLPDLAVTGTGPAGVTVLPGNGSGSFSTAFLNALTGTPSSVIVDELDDDETADLAVTDSSGNQVLVLRGNGDGSFVDRSSTPVGTSPDSVAAGDLDGDQVPDLVTSNAGSDDASVLLGQGDGTYRSATPVPVGAGPSGNDVADFDQDGHLDVVVGNADDGSVSVLLGHGDGSFEQPAPTYPAGSAPSSVSAGDLDDDGISDLAVTDGDADRVAVLIGHGDGTFSLPSFTSTAGAGGQHPVAGSEADLNGDGHVDLAVASANGTVSVLLGDGAGAFETAANLVTAGTISWLVTTDVDADERPDLAVSTDGGVTVFDNLTPFPLSLAVTRPGAVACGRHATLAGTLQATAYATRWHFEWWYPHGRHHRTRSRLVPPDDDRQPVGVKLRHLRSGAKLHYRLVAISHGTTAAGARRTIRVARHCPGVSS